MVGERAGRAKTARQHFFMGCLLQNSFFRRSEKMHEVCFAADMFFCGVIGCYLFTQVSATKMQPYFVVMCRMRLSSLIGR